MGRYNLRPSRVYQTATLAIESQSNSIKAYSPLWYKTVGSIPPGEILTRVPAMGAESKKSRTRKPSKMFIPEQLAYEEDKLRQTFYCDHPWELARPRIIVEQDGKDGQKCDWSGLLQPGRQLNAESVIQRQLWLQHNVEGMKSVEAYDVARGEFYALRHEEDVERRVAKEEALSTGAYFGKSVIEVGMQLEDQAYEEWRTWASKEIDKNQQVKSSVYTSMGTAEDESVIIPGLDSDLTDEVEEV